MKNITCRFGLLAILILSLAVPSTFAGGSDDGIYSPGMKAKIEKVKKELEKFTDGHWKDGVMIEEWLFWDNATYMKQIGIGQ